MWPLSAIAAGIAQGIREADEALSDEQAVGGLDALREIDLHPLLARSIGEMGYGIEREVAYPGAHASPVRRSARDRCDLVVLPQIGDRLEDPASEQAALLAAEGTLFAPVADEIMPDHSDVSAGEAFWVEIKVVAQHAFTDGVPVPNRGYARSLTRGLMTDTVKLAGDASIWHAAVLVLLFAETEPIASHDLAAAAHAVLDEDAPIGAPEITGCAIEDRAGNAWCGVGLFPVRMG